MVQKSYKLSCSSAGPDMVNVTVTSVNDYKGTVNLLYSVSNAGDSCTPAMGQLTPPANGQVSQGVTISSESGGGEFTANGDDGTTQEACSEPYS